MCIISLIESNKLILDYVGFHVVGFTVVLPKIEKYIPHFLRKFLKELKVTEKGGTLNIVNMLN